MAAFYLWGAEKRRQRRRPWVHQILQGREQFGEYHHLLQELRLDDGRFQRYFRLSRTQSEDLLSCVGRRIGLRDTNYWRYIPAAERLSICLRSFVLIVPCWFLMLHPCVCKPCRGILVMSVLPCLVGVCYTPALFSVVIQKRGSHTIGATRPSDHHHQARGG
ncbi:hypothetical protein ATANTOWER_024872 [Ataeniobius toweri]|uniref:Uncharacterized protein n=1 Tax=Ataeniobius toweri TaxID=208326 RepID=A0ABU7AWG0_9TELE|nr:hypothetical protein [Ataeniobius toweri]